MLVSPAHDASSRGSARRISAEWAENRGTTSRDARAGAASCESWDARSARKMDQPAPSKSELSMYTQLMRANLQAAKEAERSAKDALMSEDAGRVLAVPDGRRRTNNRRRANRCRRREATRSAGDEYDSEEEHEDARV